MVKFHLKIIRKLLNILTLKIMTYNENGEIVDLNRKFFSKIGFNYLIYLICTLVFAVILMILISNTELANNPNIHVIITAISNYILPFPIIFFLMNKLDSRTLEKESLSIQRFIMYFCISFTLMIIGNIIGLAITSLIGNATQSDISNPIQTLINSSDIMMNLIIISIIGPIFEEIIFRKLLIDRTVKYGARISIILSATLFALMHGNLNQFFYAFLLGGFFAYVYMETGKVTYTILLHIMLNLIGSVLSLIVAESADAIIQGLATPFNISIVALYMMIIFLALIFGLLGLSNYKKAKLTNIKTEVELANPMKTVFLNYGMICYIGFTILIILYITFGA